MILVTCQFSEGYITGHTHAVRHPVWPQLEFRTRTTRQNIHRFLPNTVADSGEINIVH